MKEKWNIFSYGLHILVLCSQERWFIGDVFGTFLWSNVLEYCKNRVVYCSQNSLMIDR